MVLFPPVASVVTPVIIPLRKPVNPVVDPVPGTTALFKAAVTPNPIVAPVFPTLTVVIPITWSARSSMTHTFNPSAHLPGFFAAYVKLVADL